MDDVGCSSAFKTTDSTNPFVASPHRLQERHTEVDCISTLAKSMAIEFDAVSCQPPYLTGIHMNPLALGWRPGFIAALGACEKASEWHHALWLLDVLGGNVEIGTCNCAISFLTLYIL